MRQFGLSWHFTWVCQNTPVELSPKELDRLGALSLWDDTGDIRLVCRTFGVSRATLYRWRARFDPRDLNSLKERSRRPHRLRSPKWPPFLIEAVERLRGKYPRWGNYKL